MNPKIWGKAGWKFLYSTALDYPEQPDFKVVDHYSRFFMNVQSILPCAVCRINYAKHLQQLPILPYLNNRETLFLWVVKMNNLVNIELNKPLITPQEIMQSYFGKTGQTLDCRMDSKIWGKSGWKFLFCIAYEYPREPTYTDIQNYERFFQSLQFILPCESYRRQYSKQYKRVPIQPYLTTTSYLFQWVLKMHNLVNQEIGRPLMTRKDVLSVYFKNKIETDHYHSHLSHQQIQSQTYQQLKSQVNPLIMFEGFQGNHNQSDPLLTQKNISMAVMIIILGVVASHTLN
jgi:hypothetical protein